MKNAVLWDVTPYGFCNNRCFGGTYRPYHQGDKNRQARNIRVLRLLVTTYVVRSSPILVTMMMEAIRSFETSVLTKATRRDIPEDAILHSHRCENLKSYIEGDANTI
jgi:hypothetical protein